MDETINYQQLLYIYDEEIFSIIIIPINGPRPNMEDTTDSSIEKMNECEGEYTLDDPVFYNKTADTIHFTSVKVTYMDGSVKVFSGKSLDNILSFEYNWGKSEYNPLNCVEYLRGE